MGIDLVQWNLGPVSGGSWCHWSTVQLCVCIHKNVCIWRVCIDVCVFDVCVCSFLPQALSLLEQEKSTLQEKHSQLQSDLASANLEYDRLKREYQARVEQDRNNINSLQSEMKNFRVQFEETMYVLGARERT